MFTGAVGGSERTLNSEQVSVADDAISKASEKQVKLGEQGPSRADSARGVTREGEAVKSWASAGKMGSKGGKVFQTHWQN